MSNFFGLLQNENMKIYRRTSAKVMIIILLGLILTAGLIIKLNSPEPKNDHNWKQMLVQDNKNMEKQMASVKGNKQATDYFKKTIKMNEYRIDHNLKPAQGETLWSFVQGAGSNLIIVISIFTIIVVSTSIASEFDTGTIKLLLIRPIYRTEILLSKYISTLLFTVVCLITLFIASWLVGGIFFGFGGAGEAHLVYDHGTVYQSSWTLAVWKDYLLNCVSLFMMVTFAGLIAAAFRNGGLAIGLSIFTLMASSIVVSLLAKYDWVKYVLFANTDLTQYTTGSPLRDDMTLGFSLAVLVVYYIIFVLVGWLFYTRRDIKA
ncbi:ABC transporter permease [Sporolactobacillus terrae]|uniref:ABC transporter permease n=1 Tax=Sporolactobacillus terrae TaxID=269673 RepID=A0ABX5QAN5_9BACL|nr:ABC transporter permease [Sporolactobacillus terrae]QAA23700.1 ABC transporter permease [Sporolactobacillus terrae]QAA26671.1 ABC transporter permease [Sporolactobacillus terrae]UAK15740.1 ABC transporter permease [Sporolactobacillus terrae]